MITGIDFSVDRLLQSIPPEKVNGYYVSSQVEAEVLRRLLSVEQSEKLLTSISHNSNLSSDDAIEMAKMAIPEVNANLARRSVLAGDLLDILIDDNSEKVRATLAERDDISDSVLERLASDSSKMVTTTAHSNLLRRKTPVIKDLKALCIFSLEEELERLQLTVDSIEGMCTIPEFIKAVIGTAHAEEVVAVTKPHHPSGLGGLRVLIELQRVFRNPVKGKLDRYRYLEFLAAHNQILSVSWMDTLEAAQIKHFLNEFGFEGLLTVALTNTRSSAQDIIRMYHSVTSQEHEYDSIRQTRLVCEWVAKNGLVGDGFHTYLLRKERRDGLRVERTVDFPQSIYAQSADAWNETNPSYRVTIPRNRAELSELGRGLRHCVGSRHYGNLLVDDAGYIFAISKILNGKVSVRNTGTFHVSKHGSVYQAKGFANSEVSQELMAQASSFFNALTGVELRATTAE